MLNNRYKQSKENLEYIRNKYEGEEMHDEHLPNKKFPKDYLAGATMVPKSLIGKMHTPEGQKYLKYTGQDTKRTNWDLYKKANMDINIQRGFFKRAEQCNVDKLAALRLLSKSASLIAPQTPNELQASAATALAASPAPMPVVPVPTPPAFFPTLPPDKQAFKDLTIPRALIGAGIGGLSGGALGFLSGHDDDEEDDNSTRNAILGGLAGAGMGGLVGGGFGADKYLKQQALIGIDDTIARRDKLIASGGNPAAYNKHIQQFKDVSLWNAIMHPHKLNKVMPPFSKSTKVEK